MLKKFVGLLGIGGALFLASPSAATVTLESSFVGTPVFATSSTVVVRFSITGNSSGQIPALAALRVGYDSSLFRFISASGGSLNGELGDIDPFAVGSEEVVSGSLVTRDIPTVGNFINTLSLARVMDVSLEVLTTSPVPTNITVAYDPGVSAGLNSLLDVNGNPITARTIGTPATTNFLVPVSMSSFVVE